MVWYVNNEGPITSVNACPQAGFAEREIQDDDPELLAIMGKRDSMLNGAKTVDELVDSQMNSPLAQAIIKAFATQGCEEKIRDGLMEYYKNA